MLSYKAEIPWHQSLSNLTRFHTTISGINQRYQIFQVDIRNHLVDKTLTFMDKSYQFPIINDCKYINSNMNSTYYFTFANKIVGASGEIVDQSNSKANFVHGLDGSKDLFAFAKFHKLHHKYSLNLKKIGSEKQILGLFDSQIDKIGLLHEKQGCAVVLQTIDENVRLFYGEDCSIQQEMARIDKFTIDHNYIYLMSVADKRSSPPKNNHFNSNNSAQYNREFGKIRLQAYDKQKMTRGKGYSQFEFNLPKYPLKIDSFQTDIIIAFENSLEIYDIRKITKPFQKENEGGIKDFYYEPNLQKIFLSSRKGILVFDYK